MTWKWRKVLRSKIGLMKQEFHSDETGNEGFKVEKKLKREVRPNQKEEKLHIKRKATK